MGGLAKTSGVGDLGALSQRARLLVELVMHVRQHALRCIISHTLGLVLEDEVAEGDAPACRLSCRAALMLLVVVLAQNVLDKALLLPVQVLL